MAEVYDLDVSAANNNSAPPNGFPENMQYSQVNDSAREQMAVLARFIQAIGAVTTTGAGNTYTLTISQAITALANGMVFIFKADKTNTGGATLTINALTPVSIRDNRGAALAAGDIQSGGLYHVQYDGSFFRLIGEESAATVRAKVAAANDSNVYDDAAVTKLAGIEAGATGDQTGAEIKALYEAEADTNAFTDALLSKLNGIEAGATGDQTGAEIKTLYEAEANTNAFTDADVSKLAGIESGATADQTAADIRALSGIGATTAQTGLVELATNAEAQTGTDTARAVTPAALASVTATETRDGLIEIATQAETDAGTDDARAVTPSKLANYSGLLSPEFVSKSADENVNNSTTLQNDDHLTFSNIPTGYYRVDMWLKVRDVAVINCGFKFDFTTTGVSNGTLHARHDTFAGASAPATDLIGTFFDTFNFSGLSNGSATDEIMVTGYVDVTSGTNSITLQWAQFSAGVGDLRMEAGSFLALTRLGDT